MVFMNVKVNFGGVDPAGVRLTINDLTPLSPRPSVDIYSHPSCPRIISGLNREFLTLSLDGRGQGEGEIILTKNGSSP
jgi:hypothetical protein